MPEPVSTGAVLGGAAIGAAGGLASDIINVGSAKDVNNAQNALTAASFQYNNYMYRHRYQHAVRDLKRAGINPMLAYMGAGGPGGGGSGSSAPSAQAGHVPQMRGAWAQSAAEIARTLSEKNLIDKQAEKVEAEKNEIGERTPTHAANIEKIRQDIRESLTRIDKLNQDIRVGQSSAAHLDQQVQNLRESLPQIRAATLQLNALANLNEAQATERLTASGLNTAHAKEVLQRIRSDLPALQRQLGELDRVAKQLEQPGRMADEAARSSLLGQMASYSEQLKRILNLFNPFK